MPDLKGKVALVTGASRGVGKGIALGLGEAGATVYITGRTVEEGQAVGGMPGSLHQTAAEVDQLVEDGRPFLEARVTFDDAAVKKHLSAPGTRAHLKELAARMGGAVSFDQASLDALVRDVAAERGVKPASLIHATRVAVTGRAVSPGLFEVLELLGSTRVIERVADASALAAE